MTPADEIEYTIKEIEANDDMRYYTIKSFPEIFFLKYTFHYTLEIMRDYRENDEIIKRYEELINELETRKILIENKVVYANRKIALRGNSCSKYVQIHYKNCVFTYPYAVIGTNCKNCIVENGET